MNEPTGDKGKDKLGGDGSHGETGNRRTSQAQREQTSVGFFYTRKAMRLSDNLL